MRGHAYSSCCCSPSLYEVNQAVPSGYEPNDCELAELFFVTANHLFQGDVGSAAVPRNVWICTAKMHVGLHGRWRNTVKMQSCLVDRLVKKRADGREETRSFFLLLLFW